MVYPVRGGFPCWPVCGAVFCFSSCWRFPWPWFCPFKHKSTACRRRLHRWASAESYKRRSPQRDVVRTRRLQQSLVDFGKLLCEFLVAGEPGSTAIFRTPPSPQGWGFSRRVMEPVFVPIAVPYATEEDEDSPDVDADTASPENADSPIRPARYRDSFPMADTEENEEDSASTQPLTVLVFKDTHQSGVLNYAILGDTLLTSTRGVPAESRSPTSTFRHAQSQRRPRRGLPDPGRRRPSVDPARGNRPGFCP